MIFVLFGVFGLCSSSYSEELTRDEAKERIAGSLRVAWLRFRCGLRDAFAPIVRPLSGTLNVHKWLGRVLVEMDEIRVEGTRNWVNLFMSVSRKFLSERATLYNEAAVQRAAASDARREL